MYLSSKKSIIRKVEEAFLTFKLERQLSKQRIFDLYLNYIEFDNGVFGVEAACHKYFGKSANEISVFEAVRLASIIPNPRNWNPNQPTNNLKIRSEVLLRRLYLYKKLGLTEYNDALKEFLMFFDL